MASIRELAGRLSEVLEKHVAEVEDRSQQVKRKRDELELEKRLMSSLPPPGERGPDIVKLNVGGKIYQTKRATLAMAEGSVLAAMFSGRWEENLDRDDQGRVFFDFNPEAFGVLLDCLRLCSITERGKVRLPEVHPRLKQLFEAMVSYLGVEKFLGEHGVCCDEVALSCMKVGCVEGEESISFEGGKITCCWYYTYFPVVGKTTLLSPGAHSWAAWKVSLSKYPRGSCLHAGIIENRNPEDESFDDDTSFGWKGEVWRERGEHLTEEGELQEGDNAIFLLDGARCRLRMFVERTGEIHDIALPAGVAPQARLHLNLASNSWEETVEILVSTVTPQEVARAGL